MDINAITDLKELKAVAYDQMMLQMQAENNLKIINQRIEQVTAELEQAQQAAVKPGKKAE